ncbi:hypothetical protein [Sphingobacterium bovistauri]|uniref:Lipoprotein with Yx(FWY)xxD motif n=1 Tax=Sphingobacterium bovistauri TaxID=2781959 RepID=A0ABS7Z9A3_9SPHI|nr:hypothetical protein [Sphingobacterium bovistauri]MCA5005966.1 hypothetical protein [Sphingobacterium bovistauri]
MRNILKKTTAIITTTLLFASCGDGDSAAPMENKPKGIQLADDATHGKILTDANGKTLYYFADDVDGKSACTGDCLVNWPAYYTADVTTDSKVDKAQISQITRADGTKQLTYKGWPLYYYKDDMKAKDTKGDKLGNVWYVAKPDYTVMIARTQLIGNDGKNYIQTGEGTGKTIYLTDDKGRALYVFKNDTENKNNYTKNADSEKSWPIFAPQVALFPSYISKDLISKTTVLDKAQLTYKGWPLYYFALDTKRGETKGVSMGYSQNVFTWPIINATSVNATK